MRRYSSRQRAQDTSRYARKGAGRDRMVKSKDRCEGKVMRGPGKAPTLADIWPEK